MERASLDGPSLARRIKDWGRELGFAEVGIADTDMSEAEAGLLRWLGAGMHGEMDYMERHGLTRARPQALVPGTIRIITVRMDYRPRDPRWREAAFATLEAPERAYVSRYALGRDYHKVLRQRLQRLAGRIEAEVGAFGHRVFTDSAPVMEVELARKSGLGWRGKHTLTLTREGGSMFFLGELFTDLPLPVDPPVEDHCGRCTACIDVCPTRAILAPYRLDARRCISYLTIELRGSIPEEFRAAIGNRIYGCDDCQLVCPWNKYARAAAEPDFGVRNGLDAAELVALFAWTEAEFDTRFQGSPIRRIGHACWLRNIAVALGNAPTSEGVIAALRARYDDASPLVREHVRWALARHEAKEAAA